MNVEDYLHKRGEKPPNTKLPWPITYCPEVDVSPELRAYEAVYFQSLIGVIVYILELGSADLSMETSAMASTMSLHRKGHLKVLFQIFSFLKNNHNAVMVFDPTETDIDESQFKNEDWSATAYGEFKEEMTLNTPRYHGIGFKIQSFVDSDNAGDSITHRY